MLYIYTDFINCKYPYFFRENPFAKLIFTKLFIYLQFKGFQTRL